MEDLRKSKRLPDQTVFGLKVGHHYPGNRRKLNSIMGRIKCQTANKTPQQRNLRRIDR